MYSKTCSVPYFRLNKVIFASLFIFGSCSIAYGNSEADVEVSATYVTDISGTSEVTTESFLADTTDGTVARDVSSLQGCCSMVATASATTSSATDASWSWAAAKAKSVIDVVNGPYPAEGTSLNDSYDAAAYAHYTIQWLIESAELPAGTVVPVNVRAILDGVLSFDFLARDQEMPWTPGNLITPGTWEGSLTHATVGMDMRLDAKRLSTNSTNVVFVINANLSTTDGLTIGGPTHTESFTDVSFQGGFGSTSNDPSALAYVVAVDKLLTAVEFEEVVFVVGEVYELKMRLWTSASLGRQYTWYETSGFTFKLTSDFSDTASYSLESPDPRVSFVALDSSTPDPGNTDSDGDSVPDDQDNCPSNANPSQSDVDGDGVGDHCDACPVDPSNDSDGDSFCDSVDICQGDDISGDTDTDGLCDDSDPCIGFSNTDEDLDGYCDDGDLCYGNDATGNSDGDSVCDDLDQCNGDDATGNTDGDAVCDDIDVCPLDIENDADADGICEMDDNCDIFYNPDQADSDNDGIGDLCDSDSDNDGIEDGVDNCPLHPNAGQSDFDGDGVGDECDLDNDSDGIMDSVDICLTTPLGSVVNGDGCSINDLCPCETSWKNHGSYVKCVSHTANAFADLQLIDINGHGDVVSQAAGSACGMKK